MSLTSITSRAISQAKLQNGDAANQPPKFNYNFRIRLLLGSILIAENVLRIPHATVHEAWNRFRRSDLDATKPEDVNAKIERMVQTVMFDIERSVNSDGHVRCHVEQLPSDIPAGVHLDEQNEV